MKPGILMDDSGPAVWKINVNENHEMRAGHSGMPDEKEMRKLNKAKFRQNIQEYSQEDLLAMNKLVLDRYRYLRSLKVKSYSIGERVHFDDTRRGVVINGTVVRRNKKTVTVETDIGSHWRVPPGLLRSGHSANS